MSVHAGTMAACRVYHGSDRDIPSPLSDSCDTVDSSRQSRSLSVTRQMPVHASMTAACRVYHTKKSRGLSMKFPVICRRRRGRGYLVPSHRRAVSILCAVSVDMRFLRPCPSPAPSGCRRHPHRSQWCLPCPHRRTKSVLPTASPHISAGIASAALPHIPGHTRRR